MVALIFVFVISLTRNFLPVFSSGCMTYLPCCFGTAVVLVQPAAKAKTTSTFVSAPYHMESAFKVRGELYITACSCQFLT